MAVLDLESKPHYWLTVCAQDQAVVPLHSCVQVTFFLKRIYIKKPNKGVKLSRKKRKQDMSKIFTHV